MRRSSLTLAAIVVWVCAGCGGAEEEAGTPAQAPQASDTEAAPSSPAAEQMQEPEPVAQEPAPVTTAPPQQTAVAYDEPWNPEHTGTVDPGMTYEDVVGVWGEPVAERTADGRTYLYFRNGCEMSCGTFDVVFLENGQVVDAIVRGAGHTYSGTSSSPLGAEAVATLPPSAGG